MEKDKLRVRKRIRLDRSHYQDPARVCFITIIASEKRSIFDDERLARSAIAILCRHAEMKGILVHAYCVMPEHIHLLLQTIEACDLCEFVGKLKSRIQYRGWALGERGRIWQRSFWDHFLRREESIPEVVKYILLNPVRRRLVEDWRMYPYSGSLVYNFT